MKKTIGFLAILIILLFAAGAYSQYTQPYRISYASINAALTGNPLPILQGGTNASTAAGALTNIGGAPATWNVMSEGTNYTVGAGAASEAYGTYFLDTAGITFQLPAGVKGMHCCFQATTAAAMSVKTASSDVLTLNGVALTANHKATSSSLAGDTLCIYCTAANAWSVLPGINVDFTDGGL